MLLLTGLDEHVSFGMSFRSFTQTLRGVTLHFGNGPDEEGALLVGADGLHSAVRKQYIPSMKILDTRGRCVYSKTIIDQNRLGAFLKSCLGLTLITDTSTAPLFMESIRFPKSSQSQQLPPDYVY